MFRGRSGIGLEEWVEETQVCIRARHLSTIDQAFFLFDHLEGEPRKEIKHHSATDQSDPSKIISILRELYGSSDLYVSLQEVFSPRWQHAGKQSSRVFPHTTKPNVSHKIKCTKRDAQCRRVVARSNY